jgi:arylsulfatase A-like enzyme
VQAPKTPAGGAIETPTLGRLANESIRFNQFHTTAL